MELVQVLDCITSVYMEIGFFFFSVLEVSGEGSGFFLDGYSYS